MSGRQKPRVCAVRWCSRNAVHTLGRKTGYEFYLCDEHADASVKSPPEPGVPSLG